jgi:hypothetical protein
MPVPHTVGAALGILAMHVGTLLVIASQIAADPCGSTR